MIRDARGRRTASFALQWHLTSECSLSCRHCYGRTAIDSMPTDSALALLDRFASFCRSRSVAPCLALSGGDPLLYPGFMDVYAAAAARGIPVAILGNPADGETIRAVLAIAEPVWWQVSLEGLPGRDAEIRGAGNFGRVEEFLADAHALGLRTRVMLTLTAGNADDVLPLGDFLRGKTGRFTFNRLSRTGTGADLESIAPARYEGLMREYVAAADQNPVFGLKDNLLSAAGHGRGCTGHGCGAAFDFMAVLPDGAVHACRKFDSPLGNALETSFSAIYDSAAAVRYRAGPAACAGCAALRRCGGCMAVSAGEGLDPLSDRDPHCPGRRRGIPKS